MRKLQAIPGKVRHDFPSGIAQKVKKQFQENCGAVFPRQSAKRFCQELRKNKA
ncbi:hypothetical protein [Rhizobium leguminosarum]|uniref:hypothetical protein n=1 Tax=Rhizobium leguminosarum TaxID=384 RepID=UPI0015591F8F|nr:hypothetical protein [Rhizobium leguminosarum]